MGSGLPVEGGRVGSGPPVEGGREYGGSVVGNVGGCSGEGDSIGSVFAPQGFRRESP